MIRKRTCRSIAELLTVERRGCAIAIDTAANTYKQRVKKETALMLEVLNRECVQFFGIIRAFGCQQFT
jgi:hypothetical protein